MFELSARTSRKTSRGYGLTAFGNIMYAFRRAALLLAPQSALPVSRIHPAQAAVGS
jgi:hypothetical protein